VALALANAVIGNIVVVVPQTILAYLTFVKEQFWVVLDILSVVLLARQHVVNIVLRGLGVLN
jgi:hypothetical protein